MEIKTERLLLKPVDTASPKFMLQLGVQLCNPNGRRTNRSMGNEEQTELVYEIKF